MHGSETRPSRGPPRPARWSRARHRRGPQALDRRRTRLAPGAGNDGEVARRAGGEGEGGGAARTLVMAGPRPAGPCQFGALGLRRRRHSRPEIEDALSRPLRLRRRRRITLAACTMPGRRRYRQRHAARREPRRRRGAPSDRGRRHVRRSVGDGLPAQRTLLVSQKSGALKLRTQDGALLDVAACRGSTPAPGGLGDVVPTRIMRATASSIELGRSGRGRHGRRGRRRAQFAPRTAPASTICKSSGARPPSRGPRPFGHRLAFGPDGMLYSPTATAAVRPGPGSRPASRQDRAHPRRRRDAPRQSLGRSRRRHRPL